MDHNITTEIITSLETLIGQLRSSIRNENANSQAMGGLTAAELAFADIAISVIQELWCDFTDAISCGTRFHGLSRYAAPAGLSRHEASITELCEDCICVADELARISDPVQRALHRLVDERNRLIEVIAGARVGTEPKLRSKL